MGFHLDSDKDSSGEEVGNSGAGSSSEILAEMNLTPLIDIMLVLLIIFMVTTSITLESGLDIDLPKTSAQTQQKSGNAVIISLDSKGEISVQGKKLSGEKISLDDLIKQSLATEKTTEVVFEGDTTSTVGRMIEIMDIAKKSGADKFSIATEVKN